MKKMLVTVSLLAVSAMTLFSQGRVLFNNIASGNPIYAVVPGIYAGSVYSIQLLWVPGTYTDLSTFLAANPSASVPTAFFGSTGTAPAHGPTVDGAGLFDSGTVQMGGPAGPYTMMARGWFNSGQYATYDAAVSAGVNTGLSSLFPISVTAEPVSANNTIFPSFIIGIPEPSTFALATLGVAGLLLFRRRK